MRLIYRLGTALVAMTGFVPLGAGAQSGIDTLVVTAKRLELPMAGARSLDTAEQMPGSRADAAELLRGTAGVQADSRSNYAQDTRITLRGFGARSAFGVRGLDLQIDGIPLSMPDGQGQFSGAVLDGVAQVDILTGPVAALYGNAAGGVINLKTAAPSQDRLAISTSADEDGLFRQKLHAEIKDGDFGFRLIANDMDGEGNRPHASAERTQLGAQAYYKFGDGIQAQWRFDKEDAPLLQDPLGLSQAQWEANPYQVNSSAEFFNTRKTIAHELQAISLKQDAGDGRWQLALWRGTRDISQYLAFKGDGLASSGGVVDLQRDFSGGNGNYTRDFVLAWQSLSLTLGGEWSGMRDNRKGFENNNGQAGDLRRDEADQVSNRDIYTVLQWRATPAWQWLAGVRHSHLDFSVNDHYIVPGKNADDSGERQFDRMAESLATRYELVPSLSLHAALSKGFETPTLTEMAYTNGDTGFNNRLDASQNHQQEIGLDFTRENFKSSLVIFAVQSTDELVVDQSQNGRTTYRNAAGTERKGLELNADYEFSAAWNGRVVLNYLDAYYSRGQFQSLSLIGVSLPGIARRNHYAQLNWRPFENDHLIFGLSANHRSKIATSDANDVFAPGFTVADAAVSGQILWGGFECDWWTKVNNIFNEKYVGSVIVNQSNGRAFEPASGRTLAAGIEFSKSF